MGAFEPKWVNPNHILYGGNSLRLGGPRMFHILRDLCNIEIIMRYYYNVLNYMNKNWSY